MNSPSVEEWNEICGYVLELRKSMKSPDKLGIGTEGEIIFPNGIMHPMSFLDTMRSGSADWGSGILLGLMQRQ